MRTYRCTDLIELNLQVKGDFDLDLDQGSRFLYVSEGRLLMEGQGHWLWEGLLCQLMGISTKSQQNAWNEAPYHVKIL